MDKNSKNFINQIKQEIKSVNGILYLSKGKYLKTDGFRLNGYFDTENKVKLAVATGKPLRQWLPILCHEYSHFQQFTEQCDAWTGIYFKNGEDSGIVLEDWLHGKDCDIKLVKDSIKRYRQLELDCERRSIKNIKKFNLPIDLERYTKRANAYIHFYNYLVLSRKWYTVGKEPYRVKQVLDKMPTHLNGSYEKTPKKFLELFKLYC